jgi:hypothetical protein
MKNLAGLFRAARGRGGSVIQKWELIESVSPLFIFISLTLFIIGALYGELAVLPVVLGFVSGVLITLSYFFIVAENINAAFVCAVLTAIASAFVPAIMPNASLGQMFLNGCIGIFFILGGAASMTKRFSR